MLELHAAPDASLAVTPLAHLHVSGISHRSIASGQLAHLVPDSSEAVRLHDALSADGTPCMLLITCNRVECTWLGTTTRPDAVLTHWLRERAARAEVPMDPIRPERQSGLAAARHLLRVSSGLESRLRGDSDVLGQLREAWTTARVIGRTTSTFDRIMERIVHATRHVRRRAEFDDASRTIGRVAVDALLERVNHAWPASRVLVLGSGAAATSALDALSRARPAAISVCSRTDVRAASVATRYRGVAHTPWSARQDAIAGADVVMFALRTEQPIVSDHDVPALLRSRTERALWADLGMPPNVRVTLPHDALELLPLDSLMTWRSLEDECMERAESAVERELALLMRHFLRREPATRPATVAATA